MKQLATLLKSMPGIKSIELKDVKRLADLLREAPEIGSIEVQGFFGTKVVITRTALAPAAPCRRRCSTPPRRCTTPRGTMPRRSKPHPRTPPRVPHRPSRSRKSGHRW